MKYEMQLLQQKGCSLNYTVNKGVLKMPNKDFLDKQVKFMSNNTIYVYYSNVPDSTQIKECPPKADRAETIFGV